VAELIVGILGVVVGAAGLWWGIYQTRVAARHERERDVRDVREAARREAERALEACRSLRMLMQEWYDGVQEAVIPVKTVGETRQQLDRFMRGHHFEERMQAELTKFQNPDRNRLGAAVGNFSRKALESKGSLAMRLQAAKYFRDYEAHKDEALKALLVEYDAFRAELELVTRHYQEILDAPAADR
jgi:hypothetical protein